MRHLTRATVLFTLVALVALCAPGAAKTSRELAAERRRAIDLMNEGQRLLLAEDYEAAERALTQSMQTLDSPMVRYSLAICDMRQGRALAARDHLDAALEMAPDFGQAKRARVAVAKAIAEEEAANTLIQPGGGDSAGGGSEMDGGGVTAGGGEGVGPSTVDGGEGGDGSDSNGGPVIPTPSVAGGGGDAGRPGVELNPEVAGGETDTPVVGGPTGGGGTIDVPEIDGGEPDVEPRSPLDGIPLNLTDEQKVEEPLEVVKLPDLPEDQLANALFGAKMLPPFETDSTDRIQIDKFESHKYWADHFFEKKMWDRATAEYFIAVRKNPEDLESSLRLAASLANSGRQERAAEYYRRARAKFFDRPEPFFESGEFYRKALEQHPTAVGHYRRALELDPKNPRVFNSLAIAHRRMEQDELAEQVYREGIAAIPDYAIFYRNLGVLQENSDRVSEALANYKKYVELGGEESATVESWIADIEASLATPDLEDSVDDLDQPDQPEDQPEDE